MTRTGLSRALFTTRQQEMQERSVFLSFDMIFKGGTVFDGSGSKSFLSDIGIQGWKIKAIGDLGGAESGEVIDVSGKVVCPGFIDTHSHSGIGVLADPAAPHNIMQGITTCLIGQDGMGAAPMVDQFREPWKKSMSGLEGSYDIDWNWSSVSEYMDRLDKAGTGPNFAYLAPHSNIRLSVMGLNDREPSAEEMKEMKQLLGKCLEEGCFGMSTGMIYPPCSYAKTDEFIELGRVLKETDTVFVTHQRSEADSILDSMDEIIEIGEKSGCRIHFSHFKVAGKKNWDKFPGIMKKLDICVRKGIRVSADQYPYVAGSTILSVILPPWAHDGGTDRILERLRDPEARKRMTRDILNGIHGWDNFVDFAGFDGIFITFVKTGKNSDAVGKSLVELGEMRGKEPLEAVYDLLLEEENVAGLVNFYGSEDHVRHIMQRPEQNFCTDGILGGKPHPRVYGSYPRVLGRYVRDERILEMATAIHKMTGKPAAMLGITDRGLLKEGLSADIVVFAADRVIDTADYSDPVRYPKGIEHVMVNGKMLVRNEVHHPDKAGKVIRSSGRRG